MNLYRTVSLLEGNPDLHLARLLILLLAFVKKDNPDGTIIGLTKLAKLDFLLRYPVFLERALVAHGASGAVIDVQEYERHSIESSMVRFRYGPWDMKYKHYVNVLAAKGLCAVSLEGRAVSIGLTPAGKRCAEALASTEAFAPISRRAKSLNTHFDLTATTLMKRVYETFPEITNLKWGEPIGNEHSAPVS